MCPAPLEEGGRHCADAVNIQMLGLQPSPAATAWFRYLISPEFQVQHMERGLGVSLRSDCLDVLRAEGCAGSAPGRFQHPLRGAFI